MSYRGSGKNKKDHMAQQAALLLQQQQQQQQQPYEEEGADDEHYEEEEAYSGSAGPAAAKTPGKRRKKRAYKKAPNAPRRGRSAYVLFSMDAREEVKGSLPPGSKVTEVMKGIAAKWRELSEEDKSEWIAKAAVDKDRYEQELSVYDGPLKVPNKRAKKDPLAPKRAMSAFLHFSQSMRPRLRDTYPEAKNMDMSKMLGQEWNRMSDEEKQPYQAKASDDTMRYREAMAIWREGGEGAAALAAQAKGGSAGYAKEEDEDDEDEDERT